MSNLKNLLPNADFLTKSFNLSNEILLSDLEDKLIKESKLFKEKKELLFQNINCIQELINYLNELIKRNELIFTSDYIHLTDVKLSNYTFKLFIENNEIVWHLGNLERVKEYINNSADINDKKTTYIELQLNISNIINAISNIFTSKNN